MTFLDKLILQLKSRHLRPSRNGVDKVKPVLSTYICADQLQNSYELSPILKKLGEKNPNPKSNT